ncbi:MAG TPA: 50S ribosomal protein L11 [Nitrosopumilus sp.]|nr:50S ribosomal protein L11 [Thermoproteota archaeon]HJJ22429.1 50S ribosomal protein L11 [Nitrosopumilus sp.]
MGEQKVSALVTGGAASAGPPLGPALGPLGVNIMEIIKTINDKTKDFEGMKVPVTVVVNSDTKKYEIEIGIPSAAALIMKEAGIQKGSGASGTEWAGDVTMDGIIKIANTKLEKSYASSLKSVTKTIIGTCVALGVKVEGKTPKEITAEVNEGKWDKKFQ